MKKREKQEWILQYLKDGKGFANKYINIYDKEFIDKYIEECQPEKVSIQPYGAHSVPEVGRYLSEMYHNHLLSRNRSGLNHVEPGFAKWVYVYCLRE